MKQPGEFGEYAFQINIQSHTSSKNARLVYNRTRRFSVLTEDRSRTAQDVSGREAT
jgi:hypothetical protein